MAGLGRYPCGRLKHNYHTDARSDIRKISYLISTLHGASGLVWMGAGNLTPSGIPPTALPVVCRCTD